MEDISTQVGQRLFNYRVSAVFRCGDKILLHHGLDKDHYTLPGGRVKDGESTVTALKREMKEEMGLDIEYVRPFSFIFCFLLSFLSFSGYMAFLWMLLAMLF